MRKEPLVKTPTVWTDPQRAGAAVDFGTTPISRRRLLVGTSLLAGAALLLGSCLRFLATPPRSVDTFWSDGTDWVE
jgi:hypothetical protein